MQCTDIHFLSRPGTSVIYSAGSLSLAILEMMVHAEDYAYLCEKYVYVPIIIPLSIIEEVPIDDLPHGWNSLSPTLTSQAFGDHWVRNARSAVIKVPSAVVQIEPKYIINPLHHDFKKILFKNAQQLCIDQRIIKERCQTVGARRDVPLRWRNAGHPFQV